MVFRVIARLDVKAPNLVKGIQFEGFRKVGSPVEFAKNYYTQGCDEISYQDVVASLYGRNSLVELVSETARDAFVPLSVGGGIRTVMDADLLIRHGADKVLVNTAATLNPSLIRALADRFGAQAIVVSIEAKKFGGEWLVMTDSAREHSGRRAVDWAIEAQANGAGEIFLSSVDREGTKRGFDLELIDRIRPCVQVPLIAHGGFGENDHAIAAHDSGADGVAIATAFHFGLTTVQSVKSALGNKGIEVRT